MSATTNVPKRHRMVNWYDPGQLIRTSIAVAESAVFGRHADYRLMEAIATPRPPAPDLPPPGTGDDYWLDFVADIGDGWNSTYAIAYALAQPNLSVYFEGHEYQTERGSVLVLGGDAVYPVAGRTQYKERTVAPYEAAMRCTPEPHPLVRSIPGNHDWYDSLVAFTRLFSTRPFFAGWRAQQSSSYFAIKLPKGWWLIGTDVQLDSDIDEPQIAYFKEIAKGISANDRVILCNAEPHWIYAHIYGAKDPDYNENNLAFLEDKVLGKTVSVFLAGDLHHYRRHANADGVQKITAGGGGAFLHPTHGPDVSQLSGGFELKAAYPDPNESRKIAWRNLQFLSINYSFGIVPAILYVLTAWSAMTDVSSFGVSAFGGALFTAINGSLNHPIAAYWAFLVFGGFLLLTDTHSKSYRIIAGTLHGLTHVFAAFLVGWIATYTTVNELHLPFSSTSQLLVAGAIIFVAGWIVGSILLGIYLLISLNVFKRHTNEAFSSLKVQDWKNFLRMKIDANGDLTIYPIGIERVPRHWSPRPLDGNGSEWVPDDADAKAPVLIEAPVTVRGAESLLER